MKSVSADLLPPPDDTIVVGVPHVYTAIVAVAADLAKSGIAKERKNIQQGYAFRGVDDVYNALAPVLAQHRLCIIPRAVERVCSERQTKGGGALFYVTVKCEFDLVSAVDASRHTGTTYGEAMDSADKATNKAQSAAYKYFCFQTFCIPTEADDADATTHDVAPLREPGEDSDPVRAAPNDDTISEGKTRRVYALINEALREADAWSEANVAHVSGELDRLTRQHCGRAKWQQVSWRDYERVCTAIGPIVAKLTGHA